MIRIAHFSDTHDRPSIVKAVADVECDIIVLTGDNLGNKGRIRFLGSGWDMDIGRARIHPPSERTYQERWFRKVAKKWAPAFKGRPVIYVPGNHDFIGIERWLKHYGHENVYTISAEQRCVDVLGKRFAGFREIPYMEGEWMGETRDFGPLIRDALSYRPDILVTHAPPAGVLEDDNYGVPGLLNILMYSDDVRVTHHLFGHAHRYGGKIVTEGGITFSNAACHMNIIEVP